MPSRCWLIGLARVGGGDSGHLRPASLGFASARRESPARSPAEPIRRPVKGLVRLYRVGGGIGRRSQPAGRLTQSEPAAPTGRAHCASPSGCSANRRPSARRQLAALARPLAATAPWRLAAGRPAERPASRSRVGRPPGLAGAHLLRPIGHLLRAQAGQCAQASALRAAVLAQPLDAYATFSHYSYAPAMTHNSPPLPRTLRRQQQPAGRPSNGCSRPASPAWKAQKILVYSSARPARSASWPASAGRPTLGSLGGWQ